jgi:hypothetical protein
MNGNRRAWLVGLVLAWVAAPAWAAGGVDPIKGSGQVAAETRAVTGFSGLVVDGPIDVTLKAGGVERLTVRADDNVLPLIETTVVGGKLMLATRKNASFRTRNPLQVTVEYKEMNSITLRSSGDLRGDAIRGSVFDVSIRGSGDVLLDRLEVNALAVSIAGSGNVIVRDGRADSVGVVIEGSGDARLDGLEARAAAVRVRGSGDARVFATQTLQVDIAGSGDVRYRGEPALSKRVAGSGEVVPLR